jgi:hypothetical protein
MSRRGRAFRDLETFNVTVSSRICNGRPDYRIYLLGTSAQGSQAPRQDSQEKGADYGQIVLGQELSGPICRLG